MIECIGKNGDVRLIIIMKGCKFEGKLIAGKNNPRKNSSQAVAK